MRAYLLLPSLLLAGLGTLSAQPVITLETFADGFSSPVDIAHCGDDRLFIVERAGTIRIVELDGTVLPGDFLDIADQVESGYQEQGLLGLAFHPNYATNGYFYVNYIDNDGNTVISRFSVSAGDPNLADPASELVIMNIDQPFVNHNGGCIKFGPDGYLYIGMGDGGSAGDPGDRAQNPELRLGKMLRIDVDGALPFGIPADNPFAGATDTLPEIWSSGLRNPWRFSFDQLTGDMWLADVGQNLWEELNVEPAGAGGLNYGWRCYEAFDEFNMVGCDGDTASYVFPIMDYPHNFTTGGFSITGGFVYRGSEYPAMQGYYLCADYVSGNWWWVYADGGAPWVFERVDDVQEDISAYGEDVNGELYCANLQTGEIYRIGDACGDLVVSGTVTEYICFSQDGAIDINVTGGTGPYTFDWSTGAETEDVGELEAGTYTVTVTDATGCSRVVNFTVDEIPAFEVTISADGNTLTASYCYICQWYLDGELIEGATGGTYTATESGTYTVVVTDEKGCTATSGPFDFTVGMEDLTAGNYLQVFPNPVADVLVVQYLLTGGAQDHLQLIDMTGRVLWTEQILRAGEQTITIDMRSLPAGVYQLSGSGPGVLVIRE